MRLPHQHRRREVGFNMTPMIDIVFLLIIFFLVSSHLAKREAQLELPLPAAVSGERRPAQEGPRVTVNVLSDGEFLLAGRMVLRDQLVPMFQQAIQAEGRNVEVVIRTDRRVSFQHVEPIMLSCVRAGIWNVTFAVFRPEDVH
ncbi:MAG: biopolymer transporter ExbD [Planctomycetaceae bacterium]|nr:biopolymer transporter ExbD [Planctomycetaceae bacterium]